MTLPGLGAVVSGLIANRIITQVEASNASNSQTTGFKASTVQTSDLFYNHLKKSGVFENADALRRPVGVDVGTGSKVVGVYRTLTQGDPNITNNPLDIMITGPGYFAISVPTAPNGRAFTRSGSFHVDATSRKLVTLNGDSLLDDISVPTNVDVSTVEIANDGSVTGTDDKGANVALGQLTLWTFPNEEGAQPQGKSLLVETVGSGDATQFDNVTNKLVSGALEQSNSSIITTMTNLIDAQRAYETCARFLKALSDMAKNMNDTS